MSLWIIATIAFLVLFVAGLIRLTTFQVSRERDLAALKQGKIRNLDPKMVKEISTIMLASPEIRASFYDAMQEEARRRRPPT